MGNGQDHVPVATPSRAATTLASGFFTSPCLVRMLYHAICCDVSLSVNMSEDEVCEG